ncbi:MAG TPA: restriction endonuclease [Acetobacteraceae bacterium]|nr:restriction endonuclease [Acetobacteraceae bacterium]
MLPPDALDATHTGQPAPPPAAVAPEASAAPADQPTVVAAANQGQAARSPSTSAEVAASSDQAQPESIPSSPPETDDGDSGIAVPLIIVAFVAIFGIPLLVVTSRHKRSQTALNIAITEIEAQKQNLRIRKMQLVQKDIYGTINLGKWHKEINHFSSTRIHTRLSLEGVSDLYRPLLPTFLEMIDAAADAAAANDPYTCPPRFVSDPHHFHPEMTPTDYEIYCVLQLGKAGWSARTTVVTGDQGADIVAEMGGTRLVVQCKLYSGSVGNDAVQQVSAARVFQRAHVAAVVSNAPFTKSARQLAGATKVFLLHHEQLADFRPARDAVGM